MTTISEEIIKKETTRGPIIVWENYGYEGWQPKSYSSLKEALATPRYQSEFLITKLINYDVIEKLDENS